MSKINVKQCDQCGAMLDANTAFCGNCGKRFGSSGENSPTPPLGEFQQRPITPSFSNPGLYTPSQPSYVSSPSQPDHVSAPSRRSRSNKIYLVVIAILVLMLIGTFVFFLGKASSQGSTGNTPGTPNQVVTKQANDNATSTVATASPTTLTTTPTGLTATPTELTLASSETLSENIRLTCDCSDPVVVTITKIVVEPANNRMIWSLILFNSSPNSTYARFNHFYLEKGDQVQYPTTGGQTTYDAMGGGIDTSVSLQAGETKQILLTFSFVPYKDTPYTLESELVLAYYVADDSFNPVVIQF